MVQEHGSFLPRIQGAFRVIPHKGNAKAGNPVHVFDIRHDNPFTPNVRVYPQGGLCNFNQFLLLISYPGHKMDSLENT
jgi:hypothetical protein